MKIKSLVLIGFLATAGSASAGILGQVHSALGIASTLALGIQDAPKKLRTLGGGFSAAIGHPVLIVPGFPEGFTEPVPGESRATRVANKNGLRVLGQTEVSTASDQAVLIAPKGGHNGGVAMAPVTAKPFAIKTVFESALPMLEAMFMVPKSGKSPLPSPSRPLLSPLPAIDGRGMKQIGNAGEPSPDFNDTKAQAPGLGASTTGGAAPAKIVDPKIANTQDKKVTVVAANVDLNQVVSILSQQTKANVLLLAPPDSKLTVRLQDVKFIDAIKHICTLAGLSYITANGAYILGPPDKIKAGYPEEWKAQHPEDSEVKIPVDPKTSNPPVDPPKEELISRVASINYIDAQSMVDSIKALVGDSALQVAPGPSQLSPSIVDRDTQQATGVTQGIIQADGKPVSRSVIIRGPKKLVEDALQIIKDLDQPRPQVAISVTIHDITDTALKELGVTWELGGFTISETPGAGGVNVGRFSRTGTNFIAALKGMEQTDKAKLLASPSVRVMDRERAFVLIGSRLKFPVVTGFSSNGNPIVTTQEEKVGVYLQVAPQISSDRSIMLTLYPQVSTVVSFINIQGSSYPQIDSREAQTTLRIKSGETIVIGGLYKDEELSKITQVPILAQIPLIGELFKNRKKTKTASQVIITLAIELVEPE